jgi:ACR3 family arsenite transporter
MSSFERNLTWWVFGCIAVGIVLGHAFPRLFEGIGALHEVTRHARGVGVTLFINWAVKPFSMALLAWIFIRHVFAGACQEFCV